VVRQRRRRTAALWRRHASRSLRGRGMEDELVRLYQVEEGAPSLSCAPCRFLIPEGLFIK
jgi:hypothetical protein